MNKPKPTLGLAMICQNEAIHIAPSIAQFFTVVDDIVVVDGGSTDASVEWAERMGARVFHRKFDYNFAAQKNYALEQLNTDWIYLHDPDERVEPTLIEIIQYLIDPNQGQQFLQSAGILPATAEKYDCYGMARRNFIDGFQTPIYPDYQYRLFKSNCRFERPVHEILTGWENRTEVDYTHCTLEDPARFNLLHYKSSTRQEEQDSRYAEIERENELLTLEEVRERTEETAAAGEEVYRQRKKAKYEAKLLEIRAVEEKVRLEEKTKKGDEDEHA